MMAKKNSDSDSAARIADALSRRLKDASEDVQDVPCAESLPEVDHCAPPTTDPRPEAVYEFRSPNEILPLPLRAPSDDVRGHHFQLGCELLTNLSVAFGIDTLFSQQWFFRRHLMGPLSNVISLAPEEKLTLRFTSSQRKEFTQSTLDETEETTDTESTIMDRDTLNVVRSSARSKNWSVSANGQISLPKVSFGANATTGGTVDHSVNTTRDSVQEATTRSSNNLKNLHKVEVSSVSEFSTSADSQRQISNPYRDRSMHVRVFTARKEYCTELHLESLRPVLIITPAISFDRDFVLRNGDFLVKNFLDRFLQIELTAALEAADELGPSDVALRVERKSRDALRYLFDEMTIFGVPQISAAQGDFVIERDANVVSSSFLAGIEESKTGLKDARDSHLGQVFTALNLLYHLYLEAVGDNDSERLVEITMAIEGQVGPLWDTFEDQEKLNDVLGIQQFTEIFRRLTGFLAYVRTAIRPLIAPLEEEREAAARRRRTSFVIDRVIAHMECHREYYTRLFLAYIFGLSERKALARLLTELVEEELDIPIALRKALAGSFNPGDAFLDGCDIVMPAANIRDAKAARRFLELIDGTPGPELVFGLVMAQEESLAADGVYVETATGVCRLIELPPTTEMQSFNLSITSPRQG